MKRIFTGLLTILLLFNSLSAFAEESVPIVTAQNVISRFLDRTISPDAITRPLYTESDHKMIHLTAIEAYLDHGLEADNMLYVVFKAESKDPDSLPVFLEQEHEDRIEYNGEDISLDLFRGNKRLISCELAAGESWAWYEYSDEGLFIICCIMNPDITHLKDYSKVSFLFWCENLQTGEKDNGTVTVSLPPMIEQ